MKGKQQLFFKYSSTAKIRILKSNCFTSIDYPYVYRIITKKLDFLIPKCAVLFTKNYIYIPLEIYRIQLINLYKSINYEI